MNKDIIRLTIPDKPDYISVVRLTSSSICSNMGFNIEDIEDIKVAISEACINALDKDREIEVVFNMKEDRLLITIDNVSHKGADRSDREEELSLLIIKSLMDKVEFSQEGIRMIKYIEDGNK